MKYEEPVIEAIFGETIAIAAGFPPIYFTKRRCRIVVSD